MNNTNKRNYDEGLDTLLRGAGIGIIILCFFLGFGSCCYLYDKGEALSNSNLTDRPAQISITNSFNKY